MDWLAELFETNRIIVLSIYGQVFFLMGLAVALQARHRSQLPFARPLVWLAGFGLVHGLMEWGYLFIPIQSGFLPLPIVEGLLILQLLLKPISFALLFQFGVELLLSTRDPLTVPRIGGQPWLRFVPAVAMVLWAVATIALSSTVAAGFVPEPRPWLRMEAIGAALDVGRCPARVRATRPAQCAIPRAERRHRGERQRTSLRKRAGPPVAGDSIRHRGSL